MGLSRSGLDGLDVCHMASIRGSGVGLRDEVFGLRVEGVYLRDEFLYPSRGQ